MALKVKITTRAMWERISKNARDMYRDFIFEKGRNVYGGKWWGGKYSTVYSEAKKSGDLKRQAEDYKNKVTAVLTGDTQRDANYRKSSTNGFEIGFPSMGKRVAELRRRKPKDGALTSEDQPLPDKVINYIRKEYSKEVKSKLKPRTRIHTGKGRTRTK